MIRTPDPDAEVLYLGGPLDGQRAIPGHARPWVLFRTEDGGTLPTPLGDREFCRSLRGLPQRPLYVLALSARTGCWCYVSLAMWNGFVAANWGASA